MTVLSELRAHFGDYRSPDRDADWLRHKAAHPLGSAVTAVVARQFPFGVFADAGHPFPCLLLVVRFTDARRRPYTDLSMYPQVGTELTARICGYDDTNHVFALTQLEHEEMLGESPGN